MADIRVEENRESLTWSWALLFLALVAAVVWFVLGADVNATVSEPVGMTAPTAAPTMVDSVSLQGYPTDAGVVLIQA